MITPSIPFKQTPAMSARERRSRTWAVLSLAGAAVGVALVWTGAGAGAVLLTGALLMNATHKAARR